MVVLGEGKWSCGTSGGGGEWPCELWIGRWVWGGEVKQGRFPTRAPACGAVRGAPSDAAMTGSAVQCRVHPHTHWGVAAPDMRLSLQCLALKVWGLW